MPKIKVDKLVSLILEELRKIGPPQEPMYFKSVDDALNYFGVNNNQEIEMGEMANIRTDATIEKLQTPIRIPVSELSSESKNPGKVISKDPETGEMVEDVIIGDEIMIIPSTTRTEGLRLLKFQNYAREESLDRPKFPKECVVLPEQMYYPFPPRSKKFGTQYQPKDLSMAPEEETDDERDRRLEKIKKNNEAWAKRYVIYPAINNFFGRNDILNRLDVSLIPETWAGSLRTERTTNKEIRFNFGGNGRAINIQFYAVKDFDNVEMPDGTIKSGIEVALDEIFKTRMDLESGVDLDTRKRNRSKTKPREYSNYIYRKGGRWDAIQRIYDEENFKRAGEYTRILKLLKKNIQEGKKGLNTFSKLFIDGDVQGDEYILRAKFITTLNYRTIKDGGTSLGNLFEPVYAEVRKSLPPELIDDPNFSIKTNKEFFGSAGGEGIFEELMNKLGEEMKIKIQPDDVLTKITTLLVPENVDNEFINMGDF